MKELELEINNKLPENLYLIFGEERFLILEYVNTIKKIFKSETMNDHFFNNEKVSPDSIADAFSTISLMGGRTFVMVYNSNFFFKGRSEATDYMQTLLSDLDSDSLLIFVENNVDKRNKLYKYIQKNGKTFEVKNLDEPSLSKWVISFCKKNNLTISLNDATYIVRSLGYNMNNINQELNKLISYVTDNTITRTHIDELVTKALEVRVFELIEAIGNKNSTKAIEIYNNMLLMKESPLMILTMIGRQLRIMLQCKTMVDEHMTPDEMAKKISLHPYALKKALASSKNFTKKGLYKSFEEVLETDVSIKTGKISDKLGVELVILKNSN